MAVIFDGLWHASFTVRDLNRSVAFYRDLLGLEVVASQRQANAYTRRLVGFPDADLSIAQLRIPNVEVGPSGHHLELVQYHSPVSEQQTPARNTVGAAHLAFVCRNIEEVYQHLLEQGVHFVSAPNYITEGVNRGGQTCYFLDPDGITLELVEPPGQREASGNAV